VAASAQGASETARNSEIARLLRACRDRGDAAARTRLVELHMPLVESIARRHQSGDDVDDLVKVGSVGLIHAIDGYEPGRGTDFAAYAVPNISGEIKRHLRDKTSPVRMSRRTQLRPELSDAADPATPADDQAQPKAAEMAARASRASKTDLPYEIRLLRKDDGPDGPRWVASVDELPDCVAYGETANDAARGAADAMAEWMAEAVARGARLPEPRQRLKHSGRLLVQMPQSLHADLARKADREGVSLNSLIVGVLAGGLSWQRGDRAGDGPSAAFAPKPPARRGLSHVAIVANIAVIALVAAIAIALLVVALANGW
jgi:RNA polymerase sigma factor (sigma-70 family)